MITLTARPAGVPPITRRKRFPQEAIDYVVWQIAEKFQPSKIILFDSYAYGNPRPESDVDGLVIMDSLLKESEISFQIRKSIENHFGIDFVVKTPNDLKRRIDLEMFF